MDSNHIVLFRKWSNQHLYLTAIDEFNLEANGM